ncbi:MAG: hypothetical protein ABR512_05880 [Desulfopila sp.]
MACFIAAPNITPGLALQQITQAQIYSKATRRKVLMGSPTINNGILVSVAGLLEEIQGLKFKKKKAQVSAVSAGAVSQSKSSRKDWPMQDLPSLNEDGLKISWSPDDDGMDRCRQFGKNFVEAL